MRIAFFGSGGFALPFLKSLKEFDFDIIAVVTAPAQPKGRGLKLQPTPVATLAAELSLPVFTPNNPNSENFVSLIRNLFPECGVVVDYGYILKSPLLTIPPYGFVNVHPSLLPRYRGPAPIPRQLMDGIDKTGVTVFQIDSGIDTGDILNQIELPIEPNETAGELAIRLAEAGTKLLGDTLIKLKSATVPRQPQNSSLATRAPKISKSERWIKWSQPAVVIHNLIRALSPTPGAITWFRNRPFLILRSLPMELPACDPPGTIIIHQSSLTVTTATNLIQLLQLKPANGKLISGTDFINGYRPQPGERFGDGEEKK